MSQRSDRKPAEEEEGWLEICRVWKKISVRDAELFSEFTGS